MNKTQNPQQPMFLTGTPTGNVCKTFNANGVTSLNKYFDYACVPGKVSVGKTEKNASDIHFF